LKNKWDGRANNNEIVPNGVYTWRYSYRDINGVLREQAGTVTVIR